MMISNITKKHPKKEISGTEEMPPSIPADNSPVLEEVTSADDSPVLVEEVTSRRPF